MPVPLIGAGITAAGTAGRGLLAYLAKKKAAKEMAKKMVNYRGRVYPADGTMTGGKHIANKFVNAPSRLIKGEIFGSGLGLGILGGELYDEFKNNKTTRENANNVTVEDINNAWYGLPGPTEEELQASETEAGGYGITQDQRDMINHFSKIDSMNLTHQAKEMLKEDYLRKRTGAAVTGQEDYNLEKVLREKTGAAYTGGELNTFMGMPLKEKLAEWNAPEGIFPRFFIDQLINNKTITEDDVIDLQAPDGDSFKIIPRGRGRLDKYRKLV
jgi:hypothetical protein